MKPTNEQLRERYRKVRAELAGNKKGLTAPRAGDRVSTVYCVMYVPKRTSRTWRKASVTMLDRAALEKHADALADREGWFTWVVEEDGVVHAEGIS